MATQGSSVTKASVINTFTANVRNAIRGEIVWDSANNPNSPNSRSTVSGGLSGQVTGGLQNDTPSAGEATSGLPGSVIDASDIWSLFVTYTNYYSRVRKVRFRIRYRSDSGYTTDFDQTQVASLSGSYVQSSIANPADASRPDATESIDASDLDTLTTYLKNAWNGKRDTIVSILPDTCHSSCHSSCHGSRGRR